MRALIVAMGLAALATGPALAQAGLTRASNNAGASAGTSTGSTTLPATAPSTSVGVEPVLTAPASSSDGGTAPSGVAGIASLAPEGTVSVIGGATGAPVAGAPSSGATQQAPASAASNTPIFDQAARDGRAREQRRRDRGEEPRVFGIAPNTERDLTWQMPDDRIIRY